MEQNGGFLLGRTKEEGMMVTCYRDGPSLDCRGSPFSQPQWLVPIMRQMAECLLLTFQV